MEIKIIGKECNQILKDYAFNTFGKLLGCETIEEIDIEIDTSYSIIREIKISKKRSNTNTEEESEA